MRWNLRLTAANKGIWKASELQRSLAEHGLVISAGKMSGLWSGRPVSLKLEDLDAIWAAGLAGAPAKPGAEHREPAPTDQQPNRHEGQPRQQPLDQRRDARAGRGAGTAPRRPATRRGPDPRARPAPPRRGVRTRREDRDALRGLRPPTPGATRRAALTVVPRRRWSRVQGRGNREPKSYRGAP